MKNDDEGIFDLLSQTDPINYQRHLKYDKQKGEIETWQGAQRLLKNTSELLTSLRCERD